MSEPHGSQPASPASPAVHYTGLNCSPGTAFQSPYVFARGAALPRVWLEFSSPGPSDPVDRHAYLPIGSLNSAERIQDVI